MNNDKNEIDNVDKKTAIKNALEYSEATADFDSNQEIDDFMKGKCKIIGQNVRIERKKRKFSIDNLAEYIELSASYVGLLERGDRCPSLKSLLKLCELFNVTPNDLLLSRNLGNLESQDNFDIADSNDASDIPASQKTVGAVPITRATGVSEVRRNNNYEAYEAVRSLLHGLNDGELDYFASIIKAYRSLNKSPEAKPVSDVVSFSKNKPAENDGSIAEIKVDTVSVPFTKKKSTKKDLNK